ncbi:MAG: hypothetical protein GY854_31075 [Deltaproteobacteria bacterium]|nr:hypothetical protein [Deltaproteobacteria bacterium]
MEISQYKHTSMNGTSAALRHQLLVEWSVAPGRVLLPGGEPAPIDVPGLEASGQLARTTSRGEIELLGPGVEERRIDRYRVHPRLLARLLEDQPEVAEAWVELHREGDALRPIAYLVAVPGEEPEPAALRDRLRRKLAEPLIPAAFLDTKPIPGTHQTLMREPHVAVLAERLTVASRSPRFVGLTLNKT